MEKKVEMKKVNPDAGAGRNSVSASPENSSFAADEFLRWLFEKPLPTRNDCGYPGRFECEDAARMHGFIAQEGEGPCDYPSLCEWYQEGRCPLLSGKEERK